MIVRSVGRHEPGGSVRLLLKMITPPGLRAVDLSSRTFGAEDSLAAQDAAQRRVAEPELLRVPAAFRDDQGHLMLMYAHCITIRGD